MSEDWLTIYRSYTDEALAAEITMLQGWASNPFNAQTFRGGESYARSTQNVSERLSAAIAIRNERANNEPRHGVADFSEVKV